MPSIRADVVDVYIFRRATDTVEFLQLLRADDPLRDTWHPIMGHVNEGETAVQTALRELHEEVGLLPADPSFLNMWALEQTHPFYLARLDCICLSPRFTIEVARSWQPRLNEEHSAARWSSAPASFVWPGQRAAAREVLESILAPDSLAATLLALPFRQIQ